MQWVHKMVKDTEKELFQSAFGVDSMHENFNRSAVLHLKEYIQEYIPDENKAEDASQRLTKLMELSKVRWCTTEKKNTCHKLPPSLTGH